MVSSRTRWTAGWRPLLWRESRLSLLHVEELEYATALTKNVANPAEADLLRKPQVGLVGIFLDRVAQRELVVATTHLVFNPKRGIVKLKQLQHLLSRASMRCAVRDLGHLLRGPVRLCHHRRRLDQTHSSTRCVPR